MSGSRDICDEVAAILVPYPDRAGLDADHYEVVFAEAHEERIALAEQLRTALNERGQDPVVSALEDVKHRLAAAERNRSRLLAYARAFVRPRPYPLRDLGAAAGMSASAIRSAYQQDDTEAVADMVGRRPVPTGED